MARFVNIDRESPLLLPYDIRDWIPEDHIVHFILKIENINKFHASEILISRMPELSPTGS